MEDYKTVHPHSRLGYRSPWEYIMLSSNPLCVRSNGINSSPRVALLQARHWLTCRSSCCVLGCLHLLPHYRTRPDVCL
jgi:hypothetical protein